MRLPLLLLTLCLTLASSRAGALDIVLRTEATPASTIVRLGDIAELRGARDEEQLQKFAQLPLMPAPAPNSQQYVRAQTIRDLLVAQGHDVTELHFTGATQVLLTQTAGETFASNEMSPTRPRTGYRFSVPPKPRDSAATPKVSSPATKRHKIPLTLAQMENLRAKLAEQVIQHLATSSGQSRPWRVALSLERRHAERLHHADSPIAIAGGAPPWSGLQRFLISFQSAEGEVRFPVEATISEAPLVVLAKRVIARGETLTAADVQLVPLPVEMELPAQHAPARSVEELLDHEVMRSIRAGEVVTTDMYAPPVFVRRGEAVSVSAGGGGIRVRVVAKARADGRRGEIIEVEAPDSGERYTARVIGPRQLAVLSVGTDSARTAEKQSAILTR